MRCLIIGAEGQLGVALQETSPAYAKVVALPRTQCDLTNAAQIEDWIVRLRPDIVFNAAAYTAVDAAEKDEIAAEQVNASGVRTLAFIAKRFACRLVHVSTDFVFDGKGGHAYTPEDVPNPLNAYGRTKLAGERAIFDSGAEALIVRTAWLYAPRGHSFVHTMLRLMRERCEIRVVADQIGTPTYVNNLAMALWRLSEGASCGVYHFTDDGVASWYDFAVAIGEEAAAAGLLEGCPVVVPIMTKDYPTPALRPAFSVLDKSRTWAELGHTGQHWREALRRMLERVKKDV